MHCSKKDPLFDHLIGDGEQGRRHGKAERPRGLEVDDQLDSSGPLDRQVGRSVALKNSADVEADRPAIEERIGDNQEPARSQLDPGRKGLIAARYCGPYYPPPRSFARRGSSAPP
jgi:hypothetical protein